MNSQVWWFVARSSGIVAWALLTTAVCWGLLLSTRVTRERVAARRLSPAWLLDLHRHLGGLAVLFTAVHLVGLVADDYVTFGWVEVLIPMASEWRPGAVAVGVVAMYLLVAIEATSLAARHLPRRVWRWIHRSSFVLYGLATYHGVAAGTDAGHGLFQLAAWGSVVAVVVLTGRWLLAARRATGRAVAPTDTVAGAASADGRPRPSPRAVPSVPPPDATIAPLPGSVALPPPVAHVPTPPRESAMPPPRPSPRLSTSEPPPPPPPPSPLSPPQSPRVPVTAAGGELVNAGDAGGGVLGHPTGAT